jgi:hypothetical protein
MALMTKEYELTDEDETLIRQTFELPTKRISVIPIERRLEIARNYPQSEWQCLLDVAAETAWQDWKDWQRKRREKARREKANP